MKQILNTLLLAFLTGIIGFFIGQHFPYVSDAPSKQVIVNETEKHTELTKTSKPQDKLKAQSDQPKYLRETLFQIFPLGKKTLMPSIVSNSSGILTKQFFETQFRIFQSEIIINKAINDYQLEKLWGEQQNELLAKIKKHISLNQLEGTDLIKLQTYAANDLKAQQLAYALVMSFDDYKRQILSRRAVDIKNMYREKIKKQKDKVKSQQTKLFLICKELGIVHHDLNSTEENTDPYKSKDYPKNLTPEQQTKFVKIKDKYQREFHILNSLKEAELSETLIHQLDIRLVTIQKRGWTSEVEKMMKTRKN